MSTIYQRIEKKQDKILHKVKEDAKKELIHIRVEELYRGKSVGEKIQGILKIWSA